MTDRHPTDALCRAFPSGALIEAMAQRARILASENRIRLLMLLRNSEMPVGKLALLSGLCQPTASKELSVLRTAGMVSTRREGTSVFYRLADAQVIREIEFAASLSHE